MEKQRRGESERRRAEERRSEKRKSEKKEDAGAQKGRKVAKYCVFPMICGTGGSKSRLAKAAGAEPCGQMRDEKLHAVVARSTFRSQHVQNTPFSDHFWKLWCRKSARLCGAKHTSQVKMYKTHQNTAAPEHFWKVRCRKSASHCGAKHISKSKVKKTRGVLGTFGRSDVVSRGRRRGLCTLSKVSKEVRFLQQFQLQPPLHYTTLHYTTLHYTTLRYTTLHPATTTTTTHYATPITLDSTRLHYTMVHYTTLNYITLHYKTTLHYTHYTTLRYTTLHCTTLHHTTLHHTTPHDTTLHYILHYTTLHYTLHYTTLQLHLQLHYTSYMALH